MFWLAPRHRGPIALLRQLRPALEIIACTSVAAPGSHYLSILVVVPSERDHGIGAQLLHAVHERARQSGNTLITLYTELDNLATQRFYQRHGYTETARHPSRRLAPRGFTGLLTLHRPL